MSHVVAQKYGMHIPLNRIHEQLSHEKIKISEQTLCNLVMNLGLKVQPLIDRMKDKTFENGVIFTDDTPLKMIVKGTGKAKQSYMWIYLNGKPNAPPYHIYKFTDGHSHSYPQQHLKNFNGVIHGDAFPAYEKLDNTPDSGIIWAPCWAHARRKFYDLNPASAIRKEVLKLMRHLFRFEKIAWESSDERRLYIRQNHEKSIIDELFKFLKNKVKNSEVLPRSDVGEALGYMTSREEKFRRYLDNPDIRMDNNRAESALRKIVIGRKNWLYVGSEKSGKAAANLFSLVQTCRALKINPQEYLEDIFTRLLSHPAKKLDELLPDQWTKTPR